MPVIEVRTPDEDEFELPMVNIPTQIAGAVFDFGDLSKSRGSQGLRYVAALVTNASGGTVTLRDSNGRSFPVKASQTAEWDLVPGVGFLSLTGEAAITLGDVSVLLRVKQGA